MKSPVDAGIFNGYIFDGAFGTYYLKLTDALGGGPLPETAALDDPAAVGRIHREYIKAGATAIKTDTFGVDFDAFPDKAGEIIAAAYGIASDAASEKPGDPAAVFADVGQSAKNDYIAVADVFLALGADKFLFETLSTAAGIPEVIAHIRAVAPNAEIIVSFAVGQDGYTAHGEYYLTLIADAVNAGADIAGLNCVCGPAHMLDLLAAADCEKYRVIAMPNAGYPSLSGNRTVYNDAPDYFAAKLYELCRLGIAAAGGCCGTTPAHIAAFTELIRKSPPRVVYAEVSAAVARVSPVPAASTLLFRKKRTVAVELDAPVDTDTSHIDRAAALMKASGADIVTVPDSPLARVRADSVMTAARLTRRFGIPSLPHLSCRDRNQIALKGQLIAGWIEGMRSVLVVTGDSAARSGAQGVKDVFGFDSLKFIAYINALNADIFASSPYFICAALNTSAPNFDAELRRAEKKAAAGAGAFLTQPLFSDAHFANLRRAREALGAKLLAGIMPLAGYRNALFMAGEVPGIDIPQALIDDLKDKDADGTRAVSVSFSEEVARRASELCDGYYIMTPRKKAEFAADLLARIKNIL